MQESEDVNGLQLNSRDAAIVKKAIEEFNTHALPSGTLGATQQRQQAHATVEGAPRLPYIRRIGEKA